MKVLANDKVIIIYIFVNTYAIHVYACVSKLNKRLEIDKKCPRAKLCYNVQYIEHTVVNISSKSAASTKVNDVAPTLIDP